MKSPEFIATYRLQLNKDFTLQDAENLIPYLEALGVSHLYLSPLMESTMGSMHGYDVTDFSRISDERGGETALAALDEALWNSENGLKFILDIVPNHMGIEGENPYWFDILTKGRDSQYWPVFDLRVEPGDKLHLPVLPKSLDEVIEDGIITPALHEIYGAGFKLGDRYFPFSPETVPESFDEHYPVDLLSDIIRQQHYLPVFWEDSFNNLDYRRFFTIMDLIGVRVEDRMVFEKSHQKLFEIAGKYRSLDGVRVDHIDGLVDPAGYLDRLSEHFSNIWVEKIIARDERLSVDWPVRGTTGYEFIDAVNRLFIKPEKFASLKSDWCDRAESSWPDFDGCVYDAKEEVLTTWFPSELDRLTRLSITAENDYKTAQLFWMGMTVFLPVYRTYIYKGVLSAADKDHIETAIRKAVKRFGKEFELSCSSFLNIIYAPETKAHRAALDQWQQLSGPVMAKGLEDTAHYRFTPLAALNEVGSEVDISSASRTAILKELQNRASHWPLIMNATTSHDTKRSEDTRHRLYALTHEAVQWTAFSAQMQTDFPASGIAPEVQDLFLQAVVSTWPFAGKITDDYIDRLWAYMEKSLRERSIETCWQPPAEGFENKVENYVRQNLADKKFQQKIRGFSIPVMRIGALNSLAVQTLKILTPGLADIYQGTEMWDFSLVDPDNRRPVDFDTRIESLARLTDQAQSENRTALLSDVCQNWQTGRIKLWLTQFLLKCRSDYFPKTGMPHLREMPISGNSQHDFISWCLEDANGHPLLYVLIPCNILPQKDLNLPADILASHTLNLPGQPLINLTDQMHYDGGVLPLDQLLKNFPIAVLTAV